MTLLPSIYNRLQIVQVCKRSLNGGIRKMKAIPVNNKSKISIRLDLQIMIF